MENVISVLVNRYERGSISRRELIRGLAMLAATSSTATAAGSAIQVTGIDHVSIQASDIQRSAKFYQDVFGLPFLNEDKKTETIRLTAGNGRIAIRHGSPAGVVDHFAFAVAHLDVAAVTEEMKRHGVTPTDTGEPLTFHVVDPDGYPIQMISTRG
jgi:catechol 2,3-dioxygenase-like lactoylglutathione lyase family enzyme